MHAGTEGEWSFLSVILTTPWTQGSGICMEGCPAGLVVDEPLGSSSTKRLLQQEQGKVTLEQVGLAPAPWLMLRLGKPYGPVMAGCLDEVGRGSW